VGKLAAVERAHDVGGSEDFGAIARETGEPPFHHEWEARVLALNRLLLQRGIYNLDEFRYAIERMAPADYRAASYYEKWFLAIERLLREKGVVT